jgi:DNA helicase-2/ATP-dependent DNA helicase PcrA
MGASKGSTFNRVLIYPTKAMEAWIKDNSFKLKDNVRAKLYVALTRSRLSSTIVIDYQDGDTFLAVEKYSARL